MAVFRLCVALGPLFVAGCAHRAPAASVERDQAAVRATWEEASAALCAGDWEGYQSLWARTADIELLHPAGAEWLTGWDTIGPLYQRLIASGFRCTAGTIRMRIRIAGERDMAWATAEGTLSSAGSPGPVQRTWYTLVFARAGDEWKLVHAHASVPATR